MPKHAPPRPRPAPSCRRSEGTLCLRLPCSRYRPWKPWTRASPSSTPSSSTWRAVSRPCGTLRGGPTKYRAEPSPQVSRGKPSAGVFRGFLSVRPSPSVFRAPPWSSPGPATKATALEPISPPRSFTFEVEFEIAHSSHGRDVELTRLWASGCLPCFYTVLKI